MSDDLHSWNPQPRSQEILRRALDHVESVPYKVSLRWLFYRLLSDGTYSKKADYSGSFKPLLSTARKAFYGGWTPDTLADNTRQIVRRGTGFLSPAGWMRAVSTSLQCRLNLFENQPNYVEIWFEAAAMREQFEHHSKHITLCPFQGDWSIVKKWEAAKRLEDAHTDNPKRKLVVLYFGDLDPKGLQIPLSAMSDIREWCKPPIYFSRCGLNPGHEEAFELIENPDKPGVYQWEALDEPQAKLLITASINEHIDKKLLEERLKEQEAASKRFQKAAKRLATAWERKP